MNDEDLGILKREMKMYDLILFGYFDQICLQKKNKIKGKIFVS